MRIAVLLFAFALLCGCASYSDGPYRQMDGQQIDNNKVGSLVENTTTLKEAVSLLGTPASRQQTDPNTEILRYRSERRREATHTINGIVDSKSVQTFSQTLSLVFKNGILMEKHLVESIE